MRKYQMHTIYNYLEWGEYWNHPWDSNMLNMIRVFRKNGYRGSGNQYGSIELYLFY